MIVFMAGPMYDKQVLCTIVFMAGPMYDTFSQRSQLCFNTS